MDKNKMARQSGSQNSGYTTTSSSRDKQVRQFFDRYYTNPISYTTEEVDAVIGYFQKRGFDETAAINTAVVLLQQSKIDGLKVFELLDTLKGTTEVQLSNIVAQILNLNRSKASALGFNVKAVGTKLEQRNILV
jgi:hypothetical protein